MLDYKTPPGDLGLLACANRSMSAQLTSIRGAMDGAMRAAGDLPERVRMLVSENSNLRAYLVAQRGLLAEKDAEIESLRARLAHERERCAKVCDPSNKDRPDDWTEYARVKAECAAAIRACWSCEIEGSDRNAGAEG
jgi:hypothetical protein